MSLPTGPLTIAITGAARGIGLETARILAARGHRLALADLDTDPMEDAISGFGSTAFAHGLDVRDREAFADWLAAAERELGPLDVLINNAGIAPTAPLAFEQDPGMIRRIIEINLLGTINGTLEAVKLMLPRGRGQIINIASLAGLMGVPGLAAYAASKHGVVGFTESIRAESRGSGLQLTLVLPGPTATRMMDGTRTGPVVKLVPPRELATKIAGTVGTDRARIANPVLDGLLARLAGSLPPAASLRLSKLLRADRIYTRIDSDARSGYSAWLDRETG